MSHIATVEIVVSSLDDLDAACNRLGLKLNRGQKTYKWYGRSVGDSPLPEGMTVADLGKCEHAICIPGNETAYEIGVVRRQDGNYTLAWDYWEGGFGLQEIAGENCNALKQAYAIEAAKRTALQQGFGVNEVAQQDGSIKLQLTGGY